MVEAFAVASGKGGTGKTTSTLALGITLAEEYDVTVVDADTGMANLLFYAGLADVETTLYNVLADGGPPVEAATYERFGMSVVPCSTSLAAFESADPGRLRDVVADLAAGTDVLLLDSPATLGSKSAVLPIVLADRVVVVLQLTIPAISDGLKVQEYALSYGTDVAGTLFNRVQGGVEGVAAKADRYFEGPLLATIPESDTVAYHAGTDCGGLAALADVGPGPYRVELYAVVAGALDLPGDADALHVPSGIAAERLAGDAALAARTRAAADAGSGNRIADDRDALATFLEDEAAGAEIREAAREEAARRAEEWGFEDTIE